MAKPIIKYVIWGPESRKGEFEFCCCTQENWCNTLEQAKQELNDRDPDWEDVDTGEPGYDIPPEDYVVYKMTLEKVD